MAKYYRSFLQRKKGRSVFRHYSVALPVQFALSVVALLIFAVLKILRPLVCIRIGKLVYTRFGHLAANTELYLRRRAKNKLPPNAWHIFVSGRPANHQLLQMIRRRIPVIKNQTVLWIYDHLRLFTGDYDSLFDLPEPDRFFEVADIPPQLSFTQKEEEMGQRLLEKLGIKRGIPFVCFHVRDKAYLDKMHSYRSRENWAYLDYRDCDLENYLPAVDYLVSLGLYVIRMGYVVEKELKCDNPRIIDYASHYRTDFGDIYLCAKCKFFLSSDGGLSSIPWIFNVPVAYANGVPPLAAAGWLPGDVYITKRIWSRIKKRFLTFPEILQGGIDKWFQSQRYQQAQLEVVQNSADEILSLVKEMNARLDGTWETSPEDEELQQQYRKIFPPGHRNYGNRSRMGAAFLRENRDLLNGAVVETVVGQTQ